MREIRIMGRPVCSRAEQVRSVRGLKEGSGNGTSKARENLWGSRRGEKTSHESQSGAKGKRDGLVCQAVVHNVKGNLNERGKKTL